LELCVYAFVKLGLLINICVFFKRKEPPWLGPSRMLMEHWAIPTYMRRYDSLIPFGSPLYKLYLSMKEGSLFCFVVMRSTEPGCFRLCSLCHWKALDASDCVLCVIGKLSTRTGVWSWFHDVWTCGAKVLEYWMISSLKIKLN